MKYEWHKTRYPGIRFRVHPNRKNGVKPDVYYVIRYQKDGKRCEEALGWSTAGWTLERAVQELARLKRAATLGEGPVRLSERRKNENDRRQVAEEEATRQELESIFFESFFLDTYFPNTKTAKTVGSYKTEEIYFKNFIQPVIGKMKFMDISPFAIEKIKKQMVEGGKAARTIEYTMAIIRQIWNQARRDGLIDIDSPTKNVKLQKVDNKRIRFLEPTEANKILNHIKQHDMTAYKMTLLSLCTGMRLSEIALLKWGCIDLEQKMIHIRDTKSKRNRVAYMTNEIFDMFSGMERGEADDLVFLSQRGHTFKSAPKAYWNAISHLKLNAGITDPRERINFHSCRHTAASWMIQRGVGLYEVQKILGHQNFQTTTRYAHLSSENLRQAINKFGGVLRPPDEEKIFGS